MLNQRTIIVALALSCLLALSLIPTTTASAADVAEPKNLTAKQWTVPELDLELVRIPAGKFTMGSPSDEPSRRADETQHEVTISRPFYMGKHEVTQGEYYRLMMPDFDHETWTFKRGPMHQGAAYCYRKYKGGHIFRGSSVGGQLNLRHPMESVTWDAAVEFCRRLTETERKAGRLPKGYAYRLPTEAEWEYAARAGTKGPFNVDADSSYENLKKFAFVGHNWTAPVGDGRLPNAWGLYDMHGNVYEWCGDWYGPYPTAKTIDPAGPTEGEKRVARGGCFIGCDTTTEDPALAVHPFIRTASRYQFSPDVKGHAILGFRVVLGPEIKAGSE